MADRDKRSSLLRNGIDNGSKGSMVLKESSVSKLEWRIPGKFFGKQFRTLKKTHFSGNWAIRPSTSWSRRRRQKDPSFRSPSIANVNRLCLLQNTLQTNELECFYQESLSVQSNVLEYNFWVCPLRQGDLAMQGNIRLGSQSFTVISGTLMKTKITFSE